GGSHGNHGVVRENAPAEQRIMMRVAAAQVVQLPPQPGLLDRRQELRRKRCFNSGKQLDRRPHETYRRLKFGFADEYLHLLMAEKIMIGRQDMLGVIKSLAVSDQRTRRDAEKPPDRSRPKPARDVYSHVEPHIQDAKAVTPEKESFAELD